MTPELESFKKMLRSVLIPSKEGVPVYKIEDEYRGLTCEDIPYRKFGFNSAKEFILKMTPDAARLSMNKLREEVFLGIGTEDTKHIEQLVRFQKSKAKPKKRHGGTHSRYLSSGHRNTMQSHGTSHYHHYFQQVANKKKFDFLPSRPRLEVPQTAPLKRSVVTTGNSGFYVQVARPTVELKSTNIKRDVPPRFKQLQQQQQQPQQQEPNAHAQGDTNPIARKSVFERLGQALPVDGSSHSVQTSKITHAEGDSRRVVNSNSSSGAMRELPAATSIRSPTCEENSFAASLARCSLNSNLSDDVVHSRVLKLVENAGVWVDKLDDEYKKTFNELPPRNLREVVQKWSDLAIDESYGRGMLLAKSSASETGKKLDKLSLPDEWKFTVFVSYVQNTAKIYVRILGENYSILLEEMQDRFANMSLHPLTAVKEGLFCVAWTEEETVYESDRGIPIKRNEKCYYRVEIIKVKDNDLVEIEFVDHGGREEVKRNQLYLMPPNTSLPCQMVSCVLYGLEDLANDAFISKALQEDLPGKTCAATAKRLNDTYSVVLVEYDGDALTTVNVNSKFRKLAFQPQLPDESGRLYEASVGSVSYDGLLSLCFPGRGLSKLGSLLDRVNQPTAQSSSQEEETKWSPEMLALARAPASGWWSRAKILKIVSSSEVLVQFVDSGDVRLMNSSSLKTLSPVNDKDLLNLPYQAVCCRIKDLPEIAIHWTEEAFQRLSQLLPVGTKVLVKVSSKIDKQPFTAEIFLLQDAPSITELMKEGQENLWTFQPLDPVRKASDGEEVYITECQHPGNFWGLPAVYLKQLNVMMKEMEEYYNRPTSVEFTPSFDMLHVGDMYAVRTADNGPWYRGKISRIMVSPQVVSVQMVDFGHVFVKESVSNFRRLPNAFRLLPQLSFQMTLAGVVHNSMLWSQANTEVLHKLIVNKTFRVFVPEQSSQKNPLPVTLVNPCICDNPFIQQVLLTQQLVTSQDLVTK